MVENLTGDWVVVNLSLTHHQHLSQVDLVLLHTKTKQQFLT